jgi:hypothetical protein
VSTDPKPEGINIREDAPIANGFRNGISANGDYEPATAVTEKVTVPSAIEQEYDRMVIEKTAQETMDRLVRSGNRPAEVDTLKHYILLNNQELSIHGNINQVIEQLELTNSIEIEEEGNVIYHF